MAASAAPLDWCSPTPLSRHMSSMSGTRIRRSAFSLSMAGSPGASPSLCKMILRWPNPCSQSPKRSRACSDVPFR
eukprot:980447-Amphidinium_carterae.1